MGEVQRAHVLDIGDPKTKKKSASSTAAPTTKTVSVDGDKENHPAVNGSNGVDPKASPAHSIEKAPEDVREPSNEELAKRLQLPVSKVRKVLRVAQEPISLETPIGEEEESHLGDFIVDQNGISPSDAVINLNLREQTAQVLKTLTPREEKIIKMRFGLEDGSEHTLEEVGQNFAVTRERIRQIEAKALRKLRHPSRSHRLRTFLENGTRGM